MPINRLTDKRTVVHIYSEILSAIKRKEFASFLVRWMNLKPFIQSKVNKKENNKYIKAYT